ncbi:hypothetical protein O4443_01760 [Xylella fastidiosa subsp. pauca]|uniref:Uncharacterized protein n=1 Tax=Xylella fastidiosa (strain 9a5c) TaxID=160492 RepID=Q9PG73_XYLFA|nr:hypothetical protein [Xylella fastidiosa]AAF83239.1 hypothetical protein XF_0429 [Xylella fastidiosa 9a5c]MDG5823522.1 hypothetical protein [Xylella fastidiosa subsp. pauca]MDG5826798.1 hypothetical protein [Xylella fastidiosa subsp. pauca]TNW26778.1 hypothetical protein EIP74_11325 [Xylella fastidiosa subsp. pauca]WGZ36942.1 hypothetical protein O4443_01760 [Xylella fastidiosa subsp. pauca]
MKHPTTVLHPYATTPNPFDTTNIPINQEKQLPNRTPSPHRSNPTTNNDALSKTIAHCPTSHTA